MKIGNIWWVNGIPSSTTLFKVFYLLSPFFYQPLQRLTNLQRLANIKKLANLQRLANIQRLTNLQRLATTGNWLWESFSHRSGNATQHSSALQTFYLSFCQFFVISAKTDQKTTFCSWSHFMSCSRPPNVFCLVEFWHERGFCESQLVR